MRLRASAKINLDLRIGARRSDGYHDLQTVLQTLDLHDTVTIESRRGPFALDGDAASMPLDESNLVWRAASALWRAAGKPGDPRGVRVRVTKRIPSRAGLGGGSSDAAAALVGLSRVWRLPVTLANLMPVASSLGSDVPFFLVGGTALGLGRGERLYPLANRPRRDVVVALPAFGVSTPDAYRWLAEDRLAQPAPLTPDAARSTIDPEGVNDLEGPVERRHPRSAPSGSAWPLPGRIWPGCRGAGRPSSACSRASRRRVVRLPASSGRAARWCGPGRARETWSKVAGWPDSCPRAGLSHQAQIVYNQGFARTWWTAPSRSASPSSQVEDRDSRL